jgi:hypothetical protein
VALAPGTILIPPSALALAGHHPGLSDGYRQAMVALIAAGGLFILAGLVIQLAAWIAAVLNTHRLADPKWFQALLWGGIAGMLATPLFGLGALVLAGVMMAYLVAGPDGLAADPRPAIPAKPAIIRWAGRGYAAGGAGLVLTLVVANLTYPGRPLHGVGWPSLALVSLGITVVAAGFTVVWAAWWGAIFNAYQLPGQKWFHRLLWGGVAGAVTSPLLGLGALVLAAVLIAYRRSAPDATVGHRLAPSSEAAAAPAGLAHIR